MSSFSLMGFDVAASSAVELLALLASSLVFGYLWWRLSRGPGAHIPRGARLPPLEGGWLPWIGCALEFGKAPLSFIGRMQEKHGDIFTVHVTGKWMTFLMDPNHYHHFFSSNSVDFLAAIIPLCNAVSDAPVSSLEKEHDLLTSNIKGRLASSTGVMCPALSGHFHGFLTSSYGEEGEMELFDFVRGTMFDVVVRELYGSDNIPEDKDYIPHLLEEFIKYDLGFEYGAEQPKIFMQSWQANKCELLRMMKGILDSRLGKEREMSPKSYELYDIILPLIKDKGHAHFYGLCLLWGSQANSIPVVFWTLCRILSNPEIYKQAQDEVKDIDFKDEGGFKEEELKKLVFIKRCVMEGIRLYSPGIIIRKVVQTFTIEGMTIPAGHVVALSPYWSHKNQKYFPQPDLFNPARWEGCDLNKSKFLDGFIGFGGGRNQCPGKMFALMEMHLFVAMVIKMFSMTLMDPVPEPSTLHVIGSQHPDTKCRVHFTRQHT